jgi:transposase, IS605 OrfB family, central region
MKLTATVKLQPTPKQAKALLETLRLANQTANQISQTAWDTRTFQQYALHKEVYFSAREVSGLTSQVIVRLIAKVADAYKLDRKRLRVFQPLGAVAYDDRILRWYPAHVSIWTVGGRVSISFVCDDRTREMLTNRQGESDLLFRDGKWFLYTTVNVEEPPPGEPTEWLGVDMGIVQIATDSEGNMYSGSQVKGLRHRHRRLRAKLQAKGTHSTKRLLRKRSKKEQRFATHTNHVISKRIVQTAKALNHGIAVEDLGGIRERVTVRARQRSTLHSWSFYQLRSFLTYKAQLSGIRITAVDPRNTSRQCSECGYIDRANRKSQSLFLCISCSYAANADHNAAVNISRAAVNLPNATGTLYTPTGKARASIQLQSPAL